jgi:glycosyltransferase involved in cell wall biosynthesis
LIRVLLLSPAFPPASGGIERTAGELAAGLGDLDVRVVAGAPPQSTRRGITLPPGVHVHWAPNDPPYGRRATVALARRAVAVGLRFKPNLVLALHIRTLPAARVLHHVCRSRTVLVVHAKEMREQPALASAAVRWADAVVAVSEFARDLAREAGARPERIRIINPGVTIPPAPPPLLAQRPGPPTILTVARMNEAHKGHDVALAAMELLRARIPDARWVMVGDGSLRPELRRAAARRGLDRCVEFPGPVDDATLEGYLSSAHVFCLLSREPRGLGVGEGFGIAFIEAGAHGLPVVAGRIPGVVDAVRDGITGLLIDPEDPQAAAAALERLLTDSHLSQALAMGGVERARELQWPLVTERYRELISQVVQMPPRGEASRGWRWVQDLALGIRAGT